MKIFIKNMVCNRCISAVENVFKKEDLKITGIALGEVEIADNPDSIRLESLNQSLQSLGFEILENKSKKQIEEIKKYVILKINNLDIEDHFILSKFVADRLFKDYSLLSKNFSLHENVTLEQFFILQKIEKVKELLLYNEFSLTEISQKLGYKSVQHLSGQFKNITGFSPSTFRTLKDKKRISIDQI